MALLNAFKATSLIMNNFLIKSQDLKYLCEIRKSLIQGGFYDLRFACIIYYSFGLPDSRGREKETKNLHDMTIFSHIPL